MPSRGTVLVLWNMVEEDIYEVLRQEGPQPLPWKPDELMPELDTVVEEMAALLRATEEGGYRAHVLNLEDGLDRLLAAIRLYRPDVIMNLVESFQGDSGKEATIAGVYELLNVRYTGSRPWTLATCQDKFRTKRLLKAAGLPTPPGFLVEKEPVPADHGLAFPLIVKPVREDASAGIELASVVLGPGELEAQVRRVLTTYRMPALVEQYIDGREIHAALLGNDPPEVLPLLEMEFAEQRTEEWQPQILSYSAKWDPRSPEFYEVSCACPPESLDDGLAERMRALAVRAYQALDCRDYARVDMRVEEASGEVYILEVNPNPDLGDGAAYMQCATASGRTFAGTLAEIIEMAKQRSPAASVLAQAQPPHAEHRQAGHHDTEHEP